MLEPACGTGGIDLNMTAAGGEGSLARCGPAERGRLLRGAAAHVTARMLCSGHAQQKIELPADRPCQQSGPVLTRRRSLLRAPAGRPLASHAARRAQPDLRCAPSCARACSCACARDSSASALPPSPCRVLCLRAGTGEAILLEMHLADHGFLAPISLFWTLPCQRPRHDAKGTNTTHDASLLSPPQDTHLPSAPSSAGLSSNPLPNSLLLLAPAPPLRQRRRRPCLLGLSLFLF